MSPFRYFSSSPEVIGLVVMMYVRYPLSLRNVEDLLAERGSTSAVRPAGFGGTGLALFRRRNGPAWLAQVQSHFNQGRHLVAREIYKQRRLAALAKWRTSWLDSHLEFRPIAPNGRHARSVPNFV